MPLVESLFPRAPTVQHSVWSDLQGLTVTVLGQGDTLYEYHGSVRAHVYPLEGRVMWAQCVPGGTIHSSVHPRSIVLTDRQLCIVSHGTITTLGAPASLRTTVEGIFWAAQPGQVVLQFPTSLEGRQLDQLDSFQPSTSTCTTGGDLGRRTALWQVDGDFTMLATSIYVNAVAALSATGTSLFIIMPNSASSSSSSGEDSSPLRKRPLCHSVVCHDITAMAWVSQANRHMLCVASKNNSRSNVSSSSSCSTAMPFSVDLFHLHDVHNATMDACELQFVKVASVPVAHPSAVGVSLTPSFDTNHRITFLSWTSSQGEGEVLLHTMRSDPGAVEWCANTAPLPLTLRKPLDRIRHLSFVWRWETKWCAQLQLDDGAVGLITSVGTTVPEYDWLSLGGLDSSRTSSHSATRNVVTLSAVDGGVNGQCRLQEGERTYHIDRWPPQLRRTLNHPHAHHHLSQPQENGTYRDPAHPHPPQQRGLTTTVTLQRKNEISVVTSFHETGTTGGAASCGSSNTLSHTHTVTLLPLESESAWWAILDQWTDPILRNVFLIVVKSDDGNRGRGGGTTAAPPQCLALLEIHLLTLSHTLVTLPEGYLAARWVRAAPRATLSAKPHFVAVRQDGTVVQSYPWGEASKGAEVILLDAKRLTWCSSDRVAPALLVLGDVEDGLIYVVDDAGLHSVTLQQSSLDSSSVVQELSYLCQAQMWPQLVSLLQTLLCHDRNNAADTAAAAAAEGSHPSSLRLLLPVLLGDDHQSNANDAFPSVADDPLAPPVEFLEAAIDTLTNTTVASLSGNAQFDITLLLDSVLQALKHCSDLTDVALWNVALDWGNAASRQRYRRGSPPPRLTSMGLFWASLCDAEGSMAALTSLASATAWEQLSLAGLPFWASLSSLRRFVEGIAKHEFQKAKEVRDCVLFYMLAARKNMIIAFCKLVNDVKLAAFFGKDFANDEKARTSATSNAYAAMGKNNVRLAAGFFCLAGDIHAAAQVIVDRLGDVVLALAIVRLASNDSPVELEWFLKFVESRHEQMDVPVACQSALRIRCGRAVEGLVQHRDAALASTASLPLRGSALLALHFAKARVTAVARRSDAFLSPLEEVRLLASVGASLQSREALLSALPLLTEKVDKLPPGDCVLIADAVKLLQISTKPSNETRHGAAAFSLSTRVSRMQLDPTTFHTQRAFQSEDPLPPQHHGSSSSATADRGCPLLLSWIAAVFGRLLARGTRRDLLLALRIECALRETEFGGEGGERPREGTLSFLFHLVEKIVSLHESLTYDAEMDCEACLYAYEQGATEVRNVRFRCFAGLLLFANRQLKSGTAAASPRQLCDSTRRLICYCASTILQDCAPVMEPHHTARRAMLLRVLHTRTADLARVSSSIKTLTDCLKPITESNDSVEKFLCEGIDGLAASPRTTLLEHTACTCKLNNPSWKQMIRAMRERVWMRCFAFPLERRQLLTNLTWRNFGLPLQEREIVHQQNHAVVSVVFDHTSFDNIAVGTTSAAVLLHSQRERLVANLNQEVLREVSVERNIVLSLLAETLAKQQANPVAAVGSLGSLPCAKLTAHPHLPVFFSTHRDGYIAIFTFGEAEKPLLVWDPFGSATDKRLKQTTGVVCSPSGFFVSVGNIGSGVLSTWQYANLFEVGSPICSSLQVFRAKLTAIEFLDGPLGYLVAAVGHDDLKSRSLLKIVDPILSGKVLHELPLPFSNVEGMKYLPNTKRLLVWNDKFQCALVDTVLHSVIGQDLFYLGSIGGNTWRVSVVATSLYDDMVVVGTLDGVLGVWREQNFNFPGAGLKLAADAYGVLNTAVSHRPQVITSLSVTPSSLLIGLGDGRVDTLPLTAHSVVEWFE